MKRILAFGLILCFLIGCFGCGGEKGLEFYVLQEGSLKGNESDRDLLALAKEEGRLAFTQEDLEGYHWADHEIRLKAQPALGSVSDGGSRIFQAKEGDRFLLVLHGRLLYSGGFYSGSSSAQVQISPFIKDTSFQSFSIAFSSKYSEGADPRASEKLYNYLAECQLLASKLNEN